MEIHGSIYPEMASSLAPADLRKEFLVQGLFRRGESHFRYWETDRTVLGGIEPVGAPIPLPAPAELGSAHFLERREAGIVNLGGPGAVHADGAEHRMANLDAVYLGRGTKDVSLHSQSAAKPARFYLLSYPAHSRHPSRHVAFAQSAGESLGSRDGANERTLHKLIHPGAFPTCQLVLGVTVLSPGSVWNTMPPHTHLRRSEVYLYFNVQPGHSVFHFMGRPTAARHLVVRDLEAVLSPPWSIHSGAGMSAYGFVWGMGGENQEFADMDRADPGRLI
jgi:4-deoxy-L-threo-5-hexosulose-uronate ketol-isomerase